MRRDGTITATRSAALALLVALGAALFLVACAGSSTGTTAGGQTTPAQGAVPPTSAPATAKTSAPAGQASPEACPVLTRQEVEAALSKPVLPADVLITEGYLISCSFRDKERPALSLVSVIVQSGSQAKLGYQTRKSLATDQKSVTGLGDDAFWEESDDNLEVLMGDNAVVLTIDDEAAGDRPKVAQGLTKKVLERLPVSPSPASTNATGGPTPATTAKGPTTSSAALDACSLLTREEVEAVIGKKVDPVKTTSGDATLIGCSYQDPARKPQWFVGLTILATTPGQAKGTYEMQKTAAVDKKTIGGLGDDAYWNETFDTLGVLKDEYDISLALTADATNDNSKAAQALALRVLDRLPK
ncbi:MAG: hypothetical protein HYY30_03510 [Chloroflexi bacterium]|nr:hypothetical protein [Chloroflexota bacterium]